MPTTTAKTPARKAPTEEPRMTDGQLREAVIQLLDHEQQTKQQQEIDKKREQEAAVARREEEVEAATNRMARSIETIKYCVLSISSVMALGLIIGLVVLIEVEREAERIKGEVAAIEREAERIYEKLSNPFAAVGASFDREVKKSLGLLQNYEVPYSRSNEKEEEK